MAEPAAAPLPHPPPEAPAVEDFLTAAGWAAAARRPLAGDASARRYLRLTRGPARSVLMIATPAEAHPFQRIAAWLADLGLSPPRVLAAAPDAGLLLLEDLGDALMAPLAADAALAETLYAAAIDVLAVLHHAAPPPGALDQIPPSALSVRPPGALVPTPPPSTSAPPSHRPGATPPGVPSTALPDPGARPAPGYSPSAPTGPEPTGPAPTTPSAPPGPVPSAARPWAPSAPHHTPGLPLWSAEVAGTQAALVMETYAGAPAAAPELAHTLARAISTLAGTPTVPMLRDYHAENLIWLPDRTGPARMGLLDFQDAMLAPPGYDLVSLLRDARRDVPPDLAARATERYCAATGQDPQAVATAAAALGAARQLRILGVFARLARHGKPGYLRHMPRVWAHLQTDLAHPALAPLRTLVARHIPPPDPARLATLQ